MDLLNESADIFANSSTETVAENIDYSLLLNQNGSDVRGGTLLHPFPRQTLSLRPENHEMVRISRPLCASSPLTEWTTALPAMSNVSMNASFIMNQFVAEAYNNPINLYCPFCPDEFKLEFLLKEHIKSGHPIELKTVIRRSRYDNDVEGAEFHPCPFCHATFYLKELLPRHIVRRHTECVLTMFTDVNPDRNVHCPFCNFKVLTRHSKILVNHIEKKHASEFQIAISSKCSNRVLDACDLSYFDYKVTNSECSSLSKQMIRLSVGSERGKVKRIKSILKKTTSYPDGLNLECSNENNSHDLSIGKLTSDKRQLGLSTFSLNNSSVMEKRTVRRRLRFDLPSPESPASDDEHNKENSIFNPLKKRNFSANKKKSSWRNLFRFGKKNKDENNKKIKKQKATKMSAKMMKMSPKSLDRNKEKQETMTETLIYSSVDFRNEGVSHLAVTQFKCGICLEGFTKNALLLEHLRRNHKGLKLVPQYRCGECDAKFFRNSFLVRHCWFHHTPKCLKTGSNEILT